MKLPQIAASDEQRCPSCGAPGVRSLEECRALSENVLTRGFSRPEFFSVQRMTVDAYCLQHPDEYMKSSKSAAAHLAFMYWTLEYGRADNLPQALKEWLEGARTFVRVSPPPPMQRGSLTVRHVLGVDDPEAYAAKAEEWARSAWEAWSAHCDQARAWVEEALGLRAKR